ncbi:MAG: glycosyltransferase [Syntrophobacteraceae bacterium]|jgi:GT2 family glycosyltransferase|nr:glycosyltransferase [Syntrophobacteraceae bacterium]
MKPPPALSVILAVRNAPVQIAKCLGSLEKQAKVHPEILVVDDGSTDETASVAESFSGVRVIRLDWGGPSRARNVGVRAARGEIVAFTDSDCVPHPDWLRELLHCFDDPEVAGAGGDQVSPADETPFGRSVQDFFKTIGVMTEYIRPDESQRAIRETNHNPSCNSAYRKSAFEEVGGFSEDQFPGEDLELDLKLRRLGHKLVYNPAAVVGHYRPGSLRALASMMRRYGAGERRLVEKHGFLRMLDFQPFLILAGGFVLTAPIMAHPAAWPLLFLPWLAALGFFWVRTSSLGRGLRYTLFLTIVTACWNWGFIRGGKGWSRLASLHQES